MTKLLIAFGLMGALLAGVADRSDIAISPAYADCGGLCSYDCGGLCD
jgi:hypothetical protein